MSLLGLQVLLTGLWNLKDIQNSRRNRSKNKLVRENEVARSGLRAPESSVSKNVKSFQKNYVRVYFNQRVILARIQRNFCKHQFFVFTPLFASETREIFRTTRKVFEMNFSKWSCAQNKMIRQRVGVKEQRILLPPLILDGMFEVCWQWRKFWLVKKSLALEVASC